MGRIVAISGGTLETTEKLNKYILELTKKENPNVLFVPTASKDNAEYIAEFTAAFEKLGAKVGAATLTRKQYAESELQNMSDWADAIYVGDGNLLFMMKTWRKMQFDDILYRTFTGDSAVLAGIGAGCTCWFNCGYSNSDYNRGMTDWNYMWADNLLDLHHTSACPHYNRDAVRGFDLRLMEKGLPGFALEDNTAFTQNGDRSLFLKSTADANAYYMLYLNGEVSHKEIKLRFPDEIEETDQAAEMPY